MIKYILPTIIFLYSLLIPSNVFASHVISTNPSFRSCECASIHVVGYVASKSGAGGRFGGGTSSAFTQAQWGWQEIDNDFWHYSHHANNRNFYPSQSSQGVWVLHIKAWGGNSGTYRETLVTRGLYRYCCDSPSPKPTPIGIFYWEPFTLTGVTQYRWDIEREVVEIPGYAVEVEITYEVRKGTVSVPASVYLTE